MALKGIRSWFARKSEPLSTVAQPVLEEDPALSSLCVGNVKHVGMPADVTPTLTYDHYQGLLAVGTLSGLIKLFGQDGVEAVLKDDTQLPISQLSFHPNRGLLYAVRIDNVLAVWSVKTLQCLCTPIPLPFQVSTLYCTDTDSSYLYLGTQDGDVRVFNSERLVVTTYCLGIHNTLGETVSPAAVLGVKMQPVDASVMLIAYEGRPAAIWSFKSHKTLKTLHFESPINCFDWGSDGTTIVAGLRDGNIAIWDFASKETEPKRLLRVHSDLSIVNVSAVDRVISIAGNVLVTGGLPKGGGLSLLPSTDSPTWSNIDLPTEVYSLVPSLPDKAFVLTEKCGLFSISLQPFQPKPSFFVSILGPTRIVQSCLSTVASDGVSILDFIMGFEPVTDGNLTGGSVKETVIDAFGVLVTAHEDGLIRLWRVSKQRLTSLATLSLGSYSPYAEIPGLFDFPGTSQDVITFVDFNIALGLLIAGNYMGCIAVWRTNPGSFELLFTAKIANSAVCSGALLPSTDEVKAVFGDIAGIISVTSMTAGDVLMVADLALGKSKNRQNVLISEIVAVAESGLVVVGVSNGAVYTVNVKTLEVTQSVEGLNVDFNSETPKRSEYGIIKLLPILPLPHLLVVCYEKLGYATALPDLTQVSAIQWTAPIFSAAVNLFNTQAYVSTFSKGGVLALWSIPDLCLKWQSDTALPLK